MNLFCIKKIFPTQCIIRSVSLLLVRLRMHNKIAKIHLYTGTKTAKARAKQSKSIEREKASEWERKTARAIH